MDPTSFSSTFTKKKRNEEGSKVGFTSINNELAPITLKDSSTFANKSMYRMVPPVFYYNNQLIPLAPTASSSNSYKVNSVSSDFVLNQKDINAFKRLLDEPVVESFLDWDKCCLLADKYLLATALTYFKRANLRHSQFTPCYLFVALYLAHAMEEDDLNLKNDLVRFAMSDNQPLTQSKMQLFLRKRDKLWHEMGLRAAVNHICCDAIMQVCLPNHYIWRRERAADHGGVSLPNHIRNIVHEELNLVNSYFDCRVRCIVCKARRHMNTRSSWDESVLSRDNCSPHVCSSLNHYHNTCNEWTLRQQTCKRAQEVVDNNCNKYSLFSGSLSMFPPPNIYFKMKHDFCSPEE